MSVMQINLKINFPERQYGELPAISTIAIEQTHWSTYLGDQNAETHFQLRLNDN